MDNVLKCPWCPQCKTTMGGLFCSACGSTLVEGTVNCSKCGYNNIWPHEKFCQVCGEPVVREAVHV